VTAERDWERFFDEIYLESYAGRLHAFDSEAEAKAAVELAGRPPPADVLDCPCGFGRHSIPIAELGYRVVGVDRSPVMLAEAEERAGGREWPRFLPADYRQLPFGSATFDVVLNLFSSIGYFGDDADRVVLGEFRRVLRAGGALILEMMHRDRLVSIFAERDWEELPDGGAVLERRRFDPVRGVVETSHVLIRANGERFTFDYRIRAYTATELAAMLADAGFADVEFLGGLLDREPLSERRRLVAVARP
jgi:ubiquinone/menaquinone biosynthesis C-methylase UbiE